MAAPKKENKAKRNNFTLSLEAQKLMNKVSKYQKSKVVSQAIINHLKKDEN